ncbi:hypothetical protein ACFY2V_27420 [Streptomyces eurythermus]|uniref:hypothetical protein n=1 Tax=Streptomyces eurythermus TaxID=42237 RepID=UPI0036A0C4D7
MPGANDALGGLAYRPLAVFGHHLGALTGLELNLRGLPDPVLFTVSAHAAPQRMPRTARAPRTTEELLEYTRRLDQDGLGDLPDDPEWRETDLRPLRGDLILHDTDAYLEAAPEATPFVVVTGEQYMVAMESPPLWKKSSGPRPSRPSTCRHSLISRRHVVVTGRAAAAPPPSPWAAKSGTRSAQAARSAFLSAVRGTHQLGRDHGGGQLPRESHSHGVTAHRLLQDNGDGQLVAAPAVAEHHRDRFGDPRGRGMPQHFVFDRIHRHTSSADQGEFTRHGDS